MNQNTKEAAFLTKRHKNEKCERQIQKPVVLNGCAFYSFTSETKQNVSNSVGGHNDFMLSNSRTVINRIKKKCK